MSRWIFSVWRPAVVWRGLCYEFVVVRVLHFRKVPEHPIDVSQLVDGSGLWSNRRERPNQSSFVAFIRAFRVSRRSIGPIRHEDFLGREIQPVTDRLGLPHITWHLLRHWGATQMVEARIPIKAAQERLGHSRPDTLLGFYAHVLDASADMAATMSGHWEADFQLPWPLMQLISLGLVSNWAALLAAIEKT